MSDDLETGKNIKLMKDVEGIDEITFPEVDARYVRMFGTELGWWFGYSLWSLMYWVEPQPSEGLSDVHFIRLTLKKINQERLFLKTIIGRGNDRLDLRL